jgi:hypothetical protein
MGPGSVPTSHAQFWWAQNAPAERHLCKVDEYDASLASYRPDIYETISRTVSNLDRELRLLSLDIHGTGHPLVGHIQTGLLTTYCL